MPLRHPSPRRSGRSGRSLTVPFQGGRTVPPAVSGRPVAHHYPNEDPRTLTQPDEVAEIILYLSCAGSAAINGAAIDVAWKGQDMLSTVR